MAGPSGIASYSPTPATNATASGGNSNWAENQPASSVNNSVRQDHADLRIAFNDLIWFSYGSGDQAPGVTFLGVPYAYTSANSVTVVGADVTIPHHVGRRMKFVGGLTGTVYGTISAVAFGGGNTLITLTMDAAAVLQNEAFNGFLCQVPVTGAPIPTSALAPGAITVTVADITNNQNAGTQLGIHNNSAGVSATTAVTLDNGTHTSVFYMLGSGYTTAGMNRQDGTAIVANGLGGLSLVSALNQPVYIGVNSGEVARFTSVGLGIGKDPAYTLDMVKSANTGVFAVLSNPNAGNAAYAGFIAGNGTTNGLIYQTGTAFATAGIIRQDGTIVSAGGAGGLTLVTSVNQPIYLGVGGLEVARFTPAGLGIFVAGGVAANPAHALDIVTNSNANNGISILNATNGNNASARIDISCIDAVHSLTLLRGSALQAGNVFGFPLANASGIFDNSTSSGGLLIGCITASPTIFGISNVEGMRLQIGPSSLPQLAIGATALHNSAVFGFGFNGAVINGASVDDSNAVAGTDNAIVFNRNSTTVGSITTTLTGTAYLVVSDIRLKKNIVDANASGPVIDAIKVRAFDYLADNSHADFGFIAQELDTVFPLAVSQGREAKEADAEKGTEAEEMIPWGIDASKLVPLLVKELQSLRKRVASIEGRTIH